MTREEKRILRDAIKFVAHDNANAWHELKRQIFEGGLQGYYPVQGDFDYLARQAIDRLSHDELDRLLVEWRKSSSNESTFSDNQIFEAYARMIVGEVVERARDAAYRTIHW